MLRREPSHGQKSGWSAGAPESEVLSDTIAGRLGVLVDALEDCVVLFDTDETIRLLNPAGRMLLGLTSDTVPDTIGQLIAVESRERFENSMKSRAQERGVWYGSVLLAPYTGAPVLVSAMLLYHPASHRGPAFFSFIGRPITGAVEGGAVANLPVRFTSRVLGSLHDAVFVVETPTRYITFCNRAAEEMFGYAPGALIGQPTSVLHIDTAHYEEFGRVTRKVLAQSLRYEAEYPMRRRDGSTLDTQISVTVLDDPDTRISAVVTIIRDITADKQIAKAKSVYENQLRALVARLDMMEAQERREVAGYLHDDVIQTLARARNELASAESMTDGPSNSLLATISGLVDTAIAGLRGKISELAVPALEELGLGAALECVHEQLEAQYAIPIDFSVSGNPVRLPPIQRNVLFSGARELVLNALKHAKPTRIQVSLIYEPARVSIRVQDDGLGFRASKEPAMPRSPGGFGLFHLSERLMYVGGRLDVSPNAGPGTTVAFWVPVANNNRGV